MEYIIMWLWASGALMTLEQLIENNRELKKDNLKHPELESEVYLIFQLCCIVFWPIIITALNLNRLVNWIFKGE